MNLTYWYCPNCYNHYLNKPEKCDLANDIKRWPTGLPTGCCNEKYPLKEETYEDILSFHETWDTFEGLLIELELEGNKSEVLVFRGDMAFERQEEFVTHLEKHGVRNADV